MGLLDGEHGSIVKMSCVNGAGLEVTGGWGM